jgi:hypothetical protein
VVARLTWCVTDPCELDGARLARDRVDVQVGLYALDHQITIKPPRPATRGYPDRLLIRVDRVW